MFSYGTSWTLLFVSVGAEVVGTLALRHADGFRRLGPSLLVAASYLTAIWLMSLSVRKLEVGLAYAVWAGCGTALTALLGIVLLGESYSLLKLAGVALIVLGVVVLNLSAA